MPKNYTLSSLKALTTATIANSITNIKGKAAATEAVCNASNPPDKSRAAANRASTTPHKNFLLLLGFRSPLEVNIPSTKVAELDDVIKNVVNKTIVIKDSIFVSG